jgi:DnaJ-class molecular chaperone
MLKRKKSFLDVKLKPLNEARLAASIKSSTKEWTYPLQLTLEELFHGTNHTFHVTRQLRNKEKMQVEISLPIPAGCRAGAQFRCAGAGNECKDGNFQDIVFVIEEIPHHQFKRKRNDLYVDLRVPWEKRMARRSGELSFTGLDGQEVHARIPKTPSHIAKSIEGRTLIKEAGMPIVKDSEVVGRGDLYVKYVNETEKLHPSF